MTMFQVHLKIIIRELYLIFFECVCVCVCDKYYFNVCSRSDKLL